MEVGAVVDKLKSTGLWDNTLLVLHSDNGGEIMTQFCGSNNHPLRGGKFSNFDGGIRVNALVSGGFVPSSRRGVKEERLVAGEDWLRTYASVAGVGDRWTTDSRAVEAGLPDFDSVDQWPMLSGESAADATARSEVWIGDTTSIEFNGDGDTLVGGLLRDDGWKVVLGAENKMYVGKGANCSGRKRSNQGVSLCGGSGLLSERARRGSVLVRRKRAAERASATRECPCAAEAGC